MRNPINLVLLVGAILLSGVRGAGAASKTGLSFEDRVAAQTAIERVYWAERIWPAENPGSKPSFESAISPEAIRAKVADSIQKSKDLESEWQRPITAEQLQAEMDRMASQTKRPQVLHDLFAALDNDPYKIAECLVRPTLVDRLTLTLSSTAEASNQHKAGLSPELDAPVTDYRPAEIAANCADDTWRAPGGMPPNARSGHTSVWTGTEMIIWGGQRSDGGAPLGSRYNPATDTWTGVSPVGAPSERYVHTAVWTGTEMIIWDGLGGSTAGSGGRYNPATDTWSTVSVSGVPPWRYRHSAVWTGNRMIVWGGYGGGGGPIATGGMYDPGTDSWTLMSNTGAPAARIDHTAVWTGNRMIVWGGSNTGSTGLNTGGRFDPGSNTWLTTATAGAPSGRTMHSAVWTGSVMIIWGGSDSTGGRYDPTSDTWTPTTTVNAPSARQKHVSVWTGTRMLVWGGYNSIVVNQNTGGSYNPVTDSWTALSTVNAPPAGLAPTVYAGVWSGTEMIVWSTEGSGRYRPATDSWIPMSDFPPGRTRHVAVWTGAEMLAWGGTVSGPIVNGTKYNPALETCPG